MSYCNVGSGATELSDLGSTVLRLEQLIHKLKYRYLQFSSLNCVTITCTRGDLNNSGLAVAILNLSLSVRSDSIVRDYRWTAGPRKHTFSRWNQVALMCTSEDMSTSGLAAAILDLSLPVRSDSIVGITVGLLDPET